MAAGMTFPGSYRDSRGQEALVFRNDGAVLSTVIRGVAFSGLDFDSLSPADTTPADRLALFSLWRGDLCSCLFTMEMAVPVVVAGAAVAGHLLAELDLGGLAARGGIDREHLRLSP